MAVFGHGAMSDLSRLCPPKRTSANPNLWVRALAVDGAPLADRTVIANGSPDDLGQAIGEIFVVQQFTGAGSAARRRRG
jgi:hypothetical protein